MKKTVNIGPTVLGSGLPKICVSLTGATTSELANELTLIKKAPVDVVEWRFDLQNDQSELNLITTLNFIKEHLETIPLIFTLRTTREGGGADYTDDAYQILYSTVIGTGLIDAIDLEGTRSEIVLTQLIEEANASKIRTLLSYHNFNETPDSAILKTFANTAESLKVDIVKMAVMPRSQVDVLKFMAFSNALAAELEIPLISISMGTLGRITRFACDLTGSVMTFGILKQASAPGQIPVIRLRELLETLEV